MAPRVRLIALATAWSGRTARISIDPRYAASGFLPDEVCLLQFLIALGDLVTQVFGFALPGVRFLLQRGEIVFQLGNLQIGKRYLVLGALRVGGGLRLRLGQSGIGAGNFFIRG